MPGSLENDRATDIDALAKQHLDCSWKPRCDELNSPVLSETLVAPFGSKDNTSCVDMCPPILYTFI